MLVTLTKEGKTKIDAALVDHAANELDIVSRLGKTERGQLVALLRHLHQTLADNPN